MTFFIKKIKLSTSTHSPGFPGGWYLYSVQWFNHSECYFFSEYFNPVIVPNQFFWKKSKHYKVWWLAHKTETFNHPAGMSASKSFFTPLLWLYLILHFPLLFSKIITQFLRYLTTSLTRWTRKIFYINDSNPESIKSFFM